MSLDSSCVFDIEWHSFFDLFASVSIGLLSIRFSSLLSSSSAVEQKSDSFSGSLEARASEVVGIWNISLLSSISWTWYAVSTHFSHAVRALLRPLHSFKYTLLLLASTSARFFRRDGIGVAKEEASSSQLFDFPHFLSFGVCWLETCLLDRIVFLFCFWFCLRLHLLFFLSPLPSSSNINLLFKSLWVRSSDGTPSMSTMRSKWLSLQLLCGEESFCNCIRGEVTEELITSLCSSFELRVLFIVALAIREDVIVLDPLLPAVISSAFAAHLNGDPLHELYGLLLLSLYSSSFLLIPRFDIGIIFLPSPK